MVQTYSVPACVGLKPLPCYNLCVGGCNLGLVSKGMVWPSRTKKRLPRAFWKPTPVIVILRRWPFNRSHGGGVFDHPRSVVGGCVLVYQQHNVLWFHDGVVNDEGDSGQRCAGVRFGVICIPMCDRSLSGTFSVATRRTTIVSGVAGHCL